MRELRGPDGFRWGIMTEGIGLRSFPESDFRRRTDERNKIMIESDDPDIVAWRAEENRAGKEASWARLPKLLKDRIDKGSEDIQLYQERMDADAKMSGNTIEHSLVKFKEEGEALRKIANDARQNADNAFSKGLYDAKQYRQELNKINRSLRDANDIRKDRDKSPRNALVMDFFDAKLKQRSLERESAFEGDFWFDLYAERILNNPSFVNEDGIMNWSMRRHEDTLFRINAGEEIYSYIQERLDIHGKDFPPGVEAFENAKEELKDFWELEEGIWGIGSYEAEMIAAYYEMPVRLKRRFKQKYPIIHRLEKQLEIARNKYRRDHPDVDWYHVKYYESVPRTAYAREQAELWDDARYNNIMQGLTIGL
jgi:hypothetical protein